MEAGIGGGGYESVSQPAAHLFLKVAGHGYKVFGRETHFMPRNGKFVRKMGVADPKNAC